MIVKEIIYNGNNSILRVVTFNRVSVDVRPYHNNWNIQIEVRFYSHLVN
jgi:hypothetical protein